MILSISRRSFSFTSPATSSDRLGTRIRRRVKLHFSTEVANANQRIMAKRREQSACGDSNGEPAGPGIEAISSDLLRSGDVLSIFHSADLHRFARPALKISPALRFLAGLYAAEPLRVLDPIFSRLSAIARRVSSPLAGAKITPSAKPAPSPPANIMAFRAAFPFSPRSARAALLTRSETVSNVSSARLRTSSKRFETRSRTLSDA
jgi:hypothetical protein